MLTFKKTTIAINGAERRTGYRVAGLDPCIFRGLRVVVVRCTFGRRAWYAYEATTGRSIMPRSWAGSYSNTTREGLVQILSNHLRNAPQALWDAGQADVDYNLDA